MNSKLKDTLNKASSAASWPLSRLFAPLCPYLSSNCLRFQQASFNQRILNNGLVEQRMGAKEVDKAQGLSHEGIYGLAKAGEILGAQAMGAGALASERISAVFAQSL